MRTGTHILAGTAAAALVVGTRHPTVWVAGTLAALLPDLIDWMKIHVRQRPDITITPDPLLPQPSQIAQGVQLAIKQVHDMGRPCLVRFNPIPKNNGHFLSYAMDYPRTPNLAISVKMSGENQTALSRWNLSGVQFSAYHALPLIIHDAPKDVLFSKNETRIESYDLANERGVGHSWPIPILLMGCLTAFNYPLGLAMMAGWLSHILLDVGGFFRHAPWLPFSTRRIQGRRLWNDEDWKANLVINAASLLILIALCRAG